MNKFEFIQKVEGMGLSVKELEGGKLEVEIEGIAYVDTCPDHVPDEEDSFFAGMADEGFKVENGMILMWQVLVWDLHGIDNPENCTRHKSEALAFDYAYSKIEDYFAKKQVQ